MRITNKTEYPVDSLFNAAMDGFDHSGLFIEIKYCPAGSRRYISGTYYRRAPGYPEGRLIRLRINKRNKYPVRVAFKTSDYYTRTDSKGREVIYQKIRYEKFRKPEELMLAIFLHEFSHYIDHMEGRNGRFKQTKADKFAVEILRAMKIIR
ncbi:MAG: hypothetical protein Q7N50_12090 [Armatimonadota bacterium]|nr:hypothetical protein [Armatimonadota bacterium]